MQRVGRAGMPKLTVAGSWDSEHQRLTADDVLLLQVIMLAPCARHCVPPPPQAPQAGSVLCTMDNLRV